MKKYIVLVFILLLTVVGCRIIDQTEENMSDYPDWTTETHSNSVEPDYSMVFEQDTVLEIHIVIESDNWQDMQSDLSGNIGRMGLGRFDNSDWTPLWVPCSVYFNGIEWYHVGIRYKGNSSLLSTTQSGNNKRPFKLDFDEFEDDYPLLADQRFYGFRQLSLKNNFDDESLMREKVASDLFIDFGMPSPRTAFCALYIDHGQGLQYYGLYTIVEEVDDTVLESQFSSDAGNLYKPEGDAASFATGTYDESEFNKKIDYTGDYTDLESLYNMINSSDRTIAVDSWKTDLENVFNVDHFLKWLAANTVMQNWDTYGIMTHNYYLFNNPFDDTLTWIPWDNNEALQEGKQGGSLSLSLFEVSGNWPLIRYIIDIKNYEDIYRAYVKEFVEDVFIPSEMLVIYQNYYNLLKDYAYAEERGYSFLSNDWDFDQAVDYLIDHCLERYNAVQLYLGK